MFRNILEVECPVKGPRAAITHPVDHRVGKEDEPHVAPASLEFTSRLCAPDTACWVFSSNADSNLLEECLVSRSDLWMEVNRNSQRTAKRSAC